MITHEWRTTGAGAEAIHRLCSIAHPTHMPLSLWADGYGHEWLIGATSETRPQGGQIDCTDLELAKRLAFEHARGIGVLPGDAQVSP